MPHLQVHTCSLACVPLPSLLHAAYSRATPLWACAAGPLLRPACPFGRDGALMLDGHAMVPLRLVCYDGSSTTAPTHLATLQSICPHCPCLGLSILPPSRLLSLSPPHRNGCSACPAWPSRVDGPLVFPPSCLLSPPQERLQCLSLLPACFNPVVSLSPWLLVSFPPVSLLFAGAAAVPASCA